MATFYKRWWFWVIIILIVLPLSANFFIKFHNGPIPILESRVMWQLCELGGHTPYGTFLGEDSDCLPPNIIEGNSKESRFVCDNRYHMGRMRDYLPTQACENIGSYSQYRKLETLNDPRHRGSITESVERQYADCLPYFECSCREMDNWRSYCDILVYEFHL